MTPQPLRTDALDYPLPADLIATRPAEPRDSARMLVMRSPPGAVARDDWIIEHRRVRDLPEYLRPGDALVFNTTAVAPARLLGRRSQTGGRVEGLFLEERPDGCWLVLLRSRGRLRPGHQIGLLPRDDTAQRHAGQQPVVIELLARDGAHWIARPLLQRPAHEILAAVGRTPVPPYILRARRAEVIADEMDRQWYQTVYAALHDPARCESVAAPTAGLHFTPDLLRRIDETGVERLEVILHVGPGTFKPVMTETLAEHPMHRERYEVPPTTLDRLAQRCRRSDDERATGHEPSRPRGGSGTAEARRDRIIAVGTTTVRTLESMPDPLPAPEAGPLRGETDLLIAPPHRFRNVDGLLTNFHLPRSTLLALVAAMVGLEPLKAAYADAVHERYRFYSYGDAMLILP